MTTPPEYRADENPTVRLRYDRTLGLLKSIVLPPARILDLGPANPLSEEMKLLGYSVANTTGDLDETPDLVGCENVDLVTAFEILEHLVGPLEVLRAIKAPELLVSVPLKVWFASAYRNPSDPWDRHFHEFEDWQFDWLLEKAGWTIVDRWKWTSPIRRFGIRPLLRRFIPRYYAVHAKRRPGE